jgi:hypothetical protein
VHLEVFIRVLSGGRLRLVGLLADHGLHPDGPTGEVCRLIHPEHHAAVARELFGEAQVAHDGDAPTLVSFVADRGEVFNFTDCRRLLFGAATGGDCQGDRK